MTDLTIPGKNWTSFREQMIADKQRSCSALYAPAENKSHPCRPVIVNGQRFPSVGKACEAMGVSRDVMDRTLQGKGTRTKLQARYA